MTIDEKHRTEYKLIDPAISELTQVMQRIETLEAAADEYRRDAEKLRESDMMNRKVIEQLEEQLVQETMKSDALSTNLETMTAERNELRAEVQNLHESMRKQMDLHNAEREKLIENLKRETAERKEAVERLRNSFSQMQALMNSVQNLMGQSNHEDQ